MSADPSIPADLPDRRTKAMIERVTYQVPCVMKLIIERPADEPEVVFTPAELAAFANALQDRCEANLSQKCCLEKLLFSKSHVLSANGS